jgi:hypothetical protein
VLCWEIYFCCSGFISSHEKKVEINLCAYEVDRVCTFSCNFIDHAVMSLFAFKHDWKINFQCMYSVLWTIKMSYVLCLMMLFFILQFKIDNLDWGRYVDVYLWLKGSKSKDWRCIGHVSFSSCPLSFACHIPLGNVDYSIQPIIDEIMWSDIMRNIHNCLCLLTLMIKSHVVV